MQLMGLVENSIILLHSKYFPRQLLSFHAPGVPLPSEQPEQSTEIVQLLKIFLRRHYFRSRQSTDNATGITGASASLSTEFSNPLTRTRAHCLRSHTPRF